MNEEQDIKMTELDYKMTVPHLQMIKAALPYVTISEQRLFSLFVKIGELQHTMQLFNSGEEEAVGICSLEEGAPSTPLDMLNAMKPYGSESEQEFIDLIINFLESSRIYQSYKESFDPDEDDLSIHKKPEQDSFHSQSASAGNDSKQSQNNDNRRRNDGKQFQNSDSRQSQNNDNRRRNDSHRFPLDQFKNMLPPEQQSRIETAQMIMQTLSQFS